MKNKIMWALGAIITVTLLLAAVTTNPGKFGMMVSTDGTGNPGTWVAARGTGAAFSGSVQPAGMMVSTDGTGNPGTWTPASASTFASTGAPGWLQYLGNGSEGALSVPSGTTVTAGEHWYSSITVAAGATLGSQGGANTPNVLRSTGACNIAGTISASKTTYASWNGNPSGQTGDWAGSGGGGGGGTAGGTAGAVGGSTFVVAGGTAGGAGGGVGGTGNIYPTNNQKLLAAGFPATSPIAFSSTVLVLMGGAGGGAGGSGGGAGGVGGGIIVLVCGSLNFSGTIDASGGPGVNSTGNTLGSGGGGGGGIVLVRSPSISVNAGTINVAGGPGGTCGAFTTCGAGGTGGAGWSMVFSN